MLFIKNSLQIKLYRCTKNKKMKKYIYILKVNTNPKRAE